MRQEPKAAITGHQEQRQEAEQIVLPEVIPVFPLSATVLLPRGVLPLNIFEPRYRAMVDYAFAHDRIIGVAQPALAQTEACGACPVHEIGCAGRITFFRQVSDHRYLLELTGLQRFRIRTELPLAAEGFRRIKADWHDFSADPHEAAEAESMMHPARPRLEAALRTYFDHCGLRADWKAIQAAPCGRLVSLISMICPFDTADKQALLEAPDTRHRLEILLDLIESCSCKSGPCDSAQ